MLNEYSTLCSPSISYLINYEIQSKLYNWFDKVTDTEKKQYLRVPSVGIWSVSVVLTAITRIAAIAEAFFGGADRLLLAPFTNSCLSNARLGVSEIFLHTPKNVLRTTVIPFEFVWGLMFIFIEPKYFIISICESMKVNLNHAKAGTIGSPEHLMDLHLSAGTSYTKLIEHQNRRMRK